MFNVRLGGQVAQRNRQMRLADTAGAADLSAPGTSSPWLRELSNAPVAGTLRASSLGDRRPPGVCHFGMGMVNLQRPRPRLVHDPISS